MICSQCQSQIQLGDEFCENCGVKLSEALSDSYSEAVQESAVKQKDAGTMMTVPNVIKGTDGIYRWAYHMNMWMNPTLVITMLKVLLIASLVPTLLVAGLSLFEDGFDKALEAFITVGSVVGMIMLGLLVIAYPLVALMNGGMYCVAFEMNDRSIKHIQMEKQFKRSQVLSMITALAGAAAGNLTVAGAGLMAGSKSSTTSQFSKVNKIVARPSRHVIYLNENMTHNQIYLENEDFDAVLEFIVNRCNKARVIIK